MPHRRGVHCEQCLSLKRPCNLKSPQTSFAEAHDEKPCRVPSMSADDIFQILEKFSPILAFPLWQLRRNYRKASTKRMIELHPRHGKILRRTLLEKVLIACLCL